MNANAESIRIGAVLCRTVIAALCMAPAAHADTLTVKGGKTFTGRFLEYKTGRFYFEPTDGKRLHEMRLRVVSLRVDPPARASGRQRMKNLPGGVILEAYHEGAFVFREGDETLTIPGQQMSYLKIEVDFRREMQLAAGETAAEPPETDLEQLVQKGVVTIVHFHMPGVVSSERQGHYVKGLADKNKGRVKRVRIVLDGWDDPVAIKHDIKSAPQFWFYRKSGELSSKLTERFTTEDIDAALRAARK